MSEVLGCSLSQAVLRESAFESSKRTVGVRGRSFGESPGVTSADGMREREGSLPRDGSVKKERYYETTAILYPRHLLIAKHSAPLIDLSSFSLNKFK